MASTVSSTVPLRGEVRIENKRQEKKKEAPAAPSLSFSGQHLGVTTKQDALLGEAFPWVDRQTEYRKADSWLEANADRRPKKTSRFLHNWFSRMLHRKERPMQETLMMPSPQPCRDTPSILESLISEWVAKLAIKRRSLARRQDSGRLQISMA